VVGFLLPPTQVAKRSRGFGAQRVLPGRKEAVLRRRYKGRLCLLKTSIEKK